MISSTLARRLRYLEERFGTDAKPMTIKVVFVDPDGEVTPGFDVVVGGGSLRPLSKGNHERKSQMSSDVFR